MQSLHSIVGHSTAKPRVGELRWESPLTTPQQYDLRLVPFYVLCTAGFVSLLGLL